MFFIFLVGLELFGEFVILFVVCVYFISLDSFISIIFCFLVRIGYDISVCDFLFK